MYNLSAQAQSWYRRQSLPTKVKSCATVGVEELLELAGIDALTIVPDDLRALQSAYRDADQVSKLSIVENGAQSDDKVEHVSYIDDEEKYRADFEKADEGRAKAKTAEVRYQPQIELVDRHRQGQKADMGVRQLTSSAAFRPRLKMSSERRRVSEYKQKISSRLFLKMGQPSLVGC